MKLHDIIAAIIFVTCLSLLAYPFAKAEYKGVTALVCLVIFAWYFVRHVISVEDPTFIKRDDDNEI